MMCLYVFFSIAVVLMADARIHEEPSCSKFHFEEKVLEKLVRLEHQMEIFKNKMDAWEDKIEKQISKMTDADAVRTERFNTQLDIIQQFVDSQKAKVNDFLSGFQQQIGHMIQDMNDRGGQINKTVLALKKEHEAEFNRLKTKVIGPTIVFKTKTVANTSPSKGSLMRYTDILTNVGDGYDTTTGYFTIPHDGLYMFTVQICNTNSAWVMAQIVAADATIGTVANYDTNAYMCNSGTGVAVLKTGDKVWVKCTHKGTLYNGGRRWNSFSGVLLKNN